uniref:Putative capsid protein n=1 Tax=viral metagenome TaxID=1070528 RepID=A0A6M3IZC4_9ZZZZ
MDLIGAAGLTVGMKQTYSRRLLERALPSFVHMLYGDKNGLPTGGGKSIEWRRYERPSAATTALTEGTAGAETNVTISNVQATISQYGAYDKFSDLVDTQNFDPFIAQETDVFGEQMGDTLDQIVRNVMAGGTTVQYASIALTRGGASGVASGMYLNFAEIREVVDTLRRNDARPFEDGNYAGIIHPDTERDMFADSDIVTTFQQAGVRGDGNQMMRGEAGVFHGIKWVRTSNARIFSSVGKSGADVYGTMVFGKGFYGVLDLDAARPQVIVKQVGSSGADDPLNQYGSIGWKAAITAAILDQNFGVRIEHVTSRKNAA